MPIQLTHNDGKQTFTFVLKDQTPALTKDFIDKTVSSVLIPLLSRQLTKYNYLHRIETNTQQHAYVIASIEKVNTKYKIKVDGIKLPFELREDNIPKLSANAYSIARYFHPDVVKTKLREHCQLIATALEEEKGVLGKYHKVAIVNDEKTDNINDSIKRKNFLNSTSSPNFNDFYSQLKKVLATLNAEDLKSINHTEKTETAKEFLKCIDMLNSAGFYNVNGKPVNFWSGPKGQEQADSDLVATLSDSNTPAINILITLGTLMEKRNSKMSKLLCGAASTLFASQATGDIVVYNSSAFNKNEGKVLVMDNFHTGYELPILRQKKATGAVKSMKVSFYDHMTKTWQAPIDMMQEEKNIRLVLRSPSRHHPHPSIWDPNPLINKNRPRDGVSLSSARQLLGHWKEKARRASEAKAEPENNNITIKLS